MGWPPCSLIPSLEPMCPLCWTFVFPFSMKKHFLICWAWVLFYLNDILFCGCWGSSITIFCPLLFFSSVLFCSILFTLLLFSVSIMCANSGNNKDGGVGGSRNNNNNVGGRPVINVDTFRPRTNHFCQVCNRWIAVSPADIIDHHSRCVALAIARALGYRQ